MIRRALGTYEIGEGFEHLSSSAGTPTLLAHSDILLRGGILLRFVGPKERNDGGSEFRLDEGRDVVGAGNCLFFGAVQDLAPLADPLLGVLGIVLAIDEQR